MNTCELSTIKETEVKMFIDRISSIKVNHHADILTNHLVAIQKYIESDKLFAHEVLEIKFDIYQFKYIVSFPYLVIC